LTFARQMERIGAASARSPPRGVGRRRTRHARPDQDPGGFRAEHDGVSVVADGALVCSLVHRSRRCTSPRSQARLGGADPARRPTRAVAVPGSKQGILAERLGHWRSRRSQTTLSLPASGQAKTPEPHFNQTQSDKLVHDVLGRLRPARDLRNETQRRALLDSKLDHKLLQECGSAYAARVDRDVIDVSSAVFSDHQVAATPTSVGSRPRMRRPNHAGVHAR